MSRETARGEGPPGIGEVRPESGVLVRGGGEKAHTRSVKIRPEIGTVRTGQEGSARNREGWHGVGKVPAQDGECLDRTEASQQRGPGPFPYRRL